MNIWCHARLFEETNKGSAISLLPFAIVLCVFIDPRQHVLHGVRSCAHPVPWLIAARDAPGLGHGIILYIERSRTQTKRPNQQLYDSFNFKLCFSFSFYMWLIFHFSKKIYVVSVIIFPLRCGQLVF